jgi:hypothetical protein
VVLKILEIEEMSAGGSVISGSETSIEMPHDKPTAGSQAEPAHEPQAETCRSVGLADILKNQNIDKLGEE